MKSNSNRRWLCAAAMILAFAPFTPTANAADYPSRPVKVITQGAAGSGPDVIARLAAEELGRLWRQQVVIVNHPGAGGVIAARAAAAAEPDGYTLYIPTITAFVIMPEVQAKLPFDMGRDFVHIGFVAETPMMIGVSPALGVNSLQEFIAVAKLRSGELFYAANSHGSLPHLAGEMFRNRSGANVTFVPYPGAAAGLQDLMGGRIAMIVESIGALTGSVQGGSVKPLAVASARRLPNLPDLPTVDETIPGFEAVGWFALSAPAKTPSAVVQKVNQDLNRVLGQPGLVKKFHDLGAFARPMSPQDTSAFIRKEEQVWRPLVRAMGLAAQ
jgi:tripartite-type tricarboxylate transporter receptor subunit TctC